jgi:uncharacterized membrane protein YhaH (DUF805 family)
MGFTDAIKSVLSNYANFSGRAARSEYWWWVLALFIIHIIAAFIDEFIIIPALGVELAANSGGQPLSMIASLALLLPNIAVAVRRLHDGDRSGWWILIGFVPIIGFLVLLFWYVQRGTVGDNRFGPDPL